MDVKNLWVENNILAPLALKLDRARCAFAEKSKWQGRVVGVLIGLVGGTVITAAATLAVPLERIIRIAANILGAPFIQSYSLHNAWENLKHGALNIVATPVVGIS